MYRKVLTDFASSMRMPRILVIWATASLLASIAGPFGTFEGMGPSLRVVFWSSLVAASLVVSILLSTVLRVGAPDLSDLARDVLMAVMFTIVFTPIVILAVHLASGGGWQAEISVWMIALKVFGVSATVGAGLRIARAAAPAPTEPEVRLLRRLDGVAAGDIQRLTVENHHVDVVLRGGTVHRLLMRFADAVDELEGIEGFCVHRSHWVARAAIADVINRKGKEFVVTTDGDEVPVSRTYRTNLVDAGLLVPPTQEAAARAGLAGP